MTDSGQHTRTYQVARPADALAEIIDFGGGHPAQAILNDGEYEVTADNLRRECPDGGVCHHKCKTGCFRVAFCEPLSGVYPDNRWPDEITTCEERRGLDAVL